ncbi:MAG: hypothetical protein GF364_10680 [Candidatus Lokiarchaeota archaeon]|nr:hypothetical protein [Candidatus Lokiarchaeota archaeon]
MEDKTEQIDNVIDDIFDKPNLRAIVVSDENGLPVASRIYEEMEQDIELIISAVISTLINTGSKISTRLMMGEPTNIQMRLLNGMIIIETIQGTSCCGFLLPEEKEVNIPYYEIKIAEFVRKVKPILFPKDENESW